MSRHEFRTVESHLLIDAPILAVRRDTVVMPGDTTAVREVVEHFGAVAVVAFDGENIALVQQYRHASGRRLWELPAGLLDYANEPELETAQRELFEEAGLYADHWAVICDLVTSPGFCDEAVRVFLATDIRVGTRPEASEEEADMVLQWVPLSQAVEMVLAGEIVNGIAVAGILGAWQVVEKKMTPRDPQAAFSIRPTALAKRRQAAGLCHDMKQRS
ncbi:NUDIX hydrolase [Corynebacterium sp. HS2168-gen11]|uniref:NUDIX domain-containing protein n=1 Tax=Corynebacterium sp. HS2168-gen11 TaxID=2974027 RepID=UPI00216B6453|nr:NUDIX hydrolase [Corynebacterium sp. HS2168-gen11]MCS4535030.1 NUDIX hydrolase [Corynebacterium sp. HS2168-gen11]